MSMHKIPLTPLEHAGLKAHGLDIGTPSQLSDCFRHGVKWALDNATPQWIPVSERLPDYLKPVWIIVNGKVNKYQWLHDAGDDGCWFEPHTIDFHETECLDIDSVEMWAYCYLPPAAPEQPE